MRTAYVQAPRPSHMLNHVDKSPAVNRKHTNGAGFSHTLKAVAHSAKPDSTGGFMGALPDGRQVLVTPAPPALPPVSPAIETTLIEGVYIPEGYLQ